MTQRGYCIITVIPTTLYTRGSKPQRLAQDFTCGECSCQVTCFRRFPLIKIKTRYHIHKHTHVSCIHICIQTTTHIAQRQSENTEKHLQDPAFSDHRRAQRALQFARRRVFRPRVNSVLLGAQFFTFRNTNQTQSKIKHIFN